MENAFLPTGPWSGFYLESHNPKRGWMHLYLEFQDGQIKGEGTDYVGPWTLAGSYNETDASWVKQYVGQHSVSYRGKISEAGIQGEWDIREVLRGPFHIWPSSNTVLNELYLKEDLETEGRSRPQSVVADDPFV